jgi:hypothetical protein
MNDHVSRRPFEKPEAGNAENYSKIRYDSFNVPNFRNRWDLYRSKNEEEKSGSKGRIVYYYYVVKRVL